MNAHCPRHSSKYGLWVAYQSTGTSRSEAIIYVVASALARPARLRSFCLSGRSVEHELSDGLSRHFSFPCCGGTCRSVSDRKDRHSLRPRSVRGGPRCPPAPGASPCSPFPSWPTTSSRRRPGGCYRSRHDRRQASSCFHRGRRHHGRSCRICCMGFGTGRALDSPMNGLRRETAWSPLAMEASRNLESIHEPPLPCAVA